MTQTEYAKAKQECLSDFCKEHGFIETADVKGIFGYAFDRAYALGKQEKDANTVIQGWVARDDGERWHERELHLFTRNKPERRKLMGDWIGRPSMMLDSNLFPDLIWSDEPEPVEIIIKRKKKTENQ